MSVQGFVPVGTYRENKFTISKDWQRRAAVYLWLKPGAASPLRVGLACSDGGLGARFSLHNRWLAGLFKPDDVREQQVRALTAAGLGQEAEVWAVEVGSRDEGKALERSLRIRFGRNLALDLATPGTWIKQQMNAWRAKVR